MWALLKKYFSKLYYFPYLAREEAEANQLFIRQTEWQSIKQFVRPGSKFLDVGCGAGYNMQLAAKELVCNVRGIDPEPGQHGVGRMSGVYLSERISPGVSEDIPFSNGAFDIVFSSHVLEHVYDTQKTLKEMSRVLKDDGILIIGMPTAAMAIILLFTQLLFMFPARVFNMFFSEMTGAKKTTLKELFLPKSHSHPGKSVFFDMRYYRISNWRKMLEKYFQVHEIRLPLMCPYPELRQIFKPFKSSYFSSSVFFICTKPGQELIY